MRTRTAMAVTATSVALLASGCGGGTSGNAPAASARGTGAVAFARCMRADGISRYPDPDAGGRLVKESLPQLGVSGSRFQAAERACRHLLPDGGRPASRSAQQRVEAIALRFAQCVRAHGVPNFPDPGSDGRIPDPATAGIDQGSPKFEAANSTCRAYRPPYMPSNAAYNAWARTRG